MLVQDFKYIEVEGLGKNEARREMVQHLFHQATKLLLLEPICKTF